MPWCTGGMTFKSNIPSPWNISCCLPHWFSGEDGREDSKWWSLYGNWQPFINASRLPSSWNADATFYDSQKCFTGYKAPLSKTIMTANGCKQQIISQVLPILPYVQLFDYMSGGTEIIYSDRISDSDVAILLFIEYHYRKSTYWWQHLTKFEKTNKPWIELEVVSTGVYHKFQDHRQHWEVEKICSKKIMATYFWIIDKEI